MDLFLAVLILQLIASVVLVCKSLWTKASAKWLDVNVKVSIYVNEQTSAIRMKSPCVIVHKQDA